MESAAPAVMTLKLTSNYKGLFSNEQLKAKQKS